MDFDGTRRTEPQPLSGDRRADARQKGESIQAYRAFIAYLEHGTIHAAAEALEMNTSTLERHSRRWRWQERCRRILASHAQTWSDMLAFEELYNLDAAADFVELNERYMDAYAEFGAPRIEAYLGEALADVEKFLDQAEQEG